MRTTINDVAKAANVSKSTVSKVMSDHPSIPEKTKKRIRKVIKDLNFTPSSLAKNLATQQTQTLVVIAGIRQAHNSFEPFLYNQFAGIEEYASQKGYNLTLCNALRMESADDILERFVYSKRADGMFLQAAYLKQDLIEKLQRQQFPFVVVGEPDEFRHLHWVGSHNSGGGELAAKHLVEQGYRRIAFIAKSDVIWVRQRLRGCRMFLEEQGLKDIARYIKTGFVTVEDAFRLMSELLCLDPAPDAVICDDNYSAFGALRAIQDRGMSIPNDIGIVAFDDYPLAPYLMPQLTIVDFDTFELGMTAAKILLDTIQQPENSGKGKMTLIEPTLIVRKSTQRAKS